MHLCTAQRTLNLEALLKQPQVPCALHTVPCRGAWCGEDGFRDANSTELRVITTHRVLCKLGTAIDIAQMGDTESTAW